MLSVSVEWGAALESLPLSLNICTARLFPRTVCVRCYCNCRNTASLHLVTSLTYFYIPPLLSFSLSLYSVSPPCALEEGWNMKQPSLFWWQSLAKRAQRVQGKKKTDNDIIGANTQLIWKLSITQVRGKCGYTMSWKLGVYYLVRGPWDLSSVRTVNLN